MHAFQDFVEKCWTKLAEMAAANRAPGAPPPRFTPEKPVSYRVVRETALDAHQTEFAKAGCKRECLQKRFNYFHKPLVNNDEDTPLPRQDASRKQWKSERMQESKDLLQKNVDAKGFGHIINYAK